MLVVITVGALVFAAWQAKLREVAEQGHELERDIVRAAMMRGGRITALDVKTRRAVPMEAIEERLRALHRQGYCDSVLSGEGTHVYVFRDFDDTPARHAAIEKRILMLAETHNGIVSVRSVALATDLSYIDARSWLESMVEQRICYPTDEADVFSFTPPRRELGGTELSSESPSGAPPRRLRE